MKANYHTHSHWCRHATGELSEYIEAALAGGLEELAFTGHTPLVGDIEPSRMSWADFPAYADDLERTFARYENSPIRLYKGLECEYDERLFGHYRRCREELGFEVMVLGQHFSAAHSHHYFSVTTPDVVAVYADEVCRAVETGLFTFVAHPDVVLNSYPELDDAAADAMLRIFATCSRLGVPVEINVNGWRQRRGYPRREVWEKLAPQVPGLKCLVSADAHEVRYLCCKEVAECERMARRAGLQLLERLPL